MGPFERDWWPVELRGISQLPELQPVSCRWYVQDLRASVGPPVEATDRAACHNLDGKFQNATHGWFKNTYRRCHGSRNVEDDAHDGVQVEHHEHGGEEVRDEAAWLLMSITGAFKKWTVTYAIMK